MHWRRKWQPIPVFLPRESQGRGSLVGCRLWGHKSRTRLKRLSSSSRGHRWLREPSLRGRGCRRPHSHRQKNPYVRGPTERATRDGPGPRHWDPSKHRRGGTGPGGCWSCLCHLKCAVVGSGLAPEAEPCEIPFLCLSGGWPAGPGSLCCGCRTTAQKQPREAFLPRPGHPRPQPLPTGQCLPP